MLSEERLAEIRELNDAEMYDSGGCEPGTVITELLDEVERLSPLAGIANISNPARGLHTPGPWTVENDPVNEDGLIIVEAGKPTYEWRVIASLSASDFDDGPPFITQTNNNANARLISAAPELLAACKMAYDLLPWSTEAERNARAVIDTAIRRAQSPPVAASAGPAETAAGDKKCAWCKSEMDGKHCPKCDPSLYELIPDIESRG